MAPSLEYHANLATPRTRTATRSPIRSRTPHVTRHGVAHAVRPANLSSGRVSRTALARVSYVLLLASAVLAIVISTLSTPDQPTPAAWSAITVEPSATLWSIAQAHPVPGLGTAEAVALIKESNGLESAHIAPGQTLIVPAADATAVAALSP